MTAIVAFPPARESKARTVNERPRQPASAFFATATTPDRLTHRCKECVLAAGRRDRAERGARTQKAQAPPACATDGASLVYLATNAGQKPRAIMIVILRFLNICGGLILKAAHREAVASRIVPVSVSQIICDLCNVPLLGPEPQTFKPGN